jgi:glycosyltransferase involved in cell wall biosynthesis
MKVSNSEVHSQMAANEIFEVLHLGTKSNKNLERTLEALKGLPVQLTIIGKLHKNHVALLAQFQLNYINLYDLTFEKIIEEYQKCHFVCFASTYEGFGMPIIEAQALGKPIITSNIARNCR